MKKLLLFVSFIFISFNLLPQGGPLQVFASGGNPGSAICPGSCTMVGCQAIGGTQPYTYNWMPGGGSTQSYTVCPTATTTYTITVTDQTGATASNSAVVTVGPAPTITATGDVICSGNNGTLTASGGVGYTWSAGTMPQFGSSVSASPTTTTTYTVVGMTQQGCTNSATAEIVVNVCTVIRESVTAGEPSLAARFTQEGKLHVFYSSPQAGTFILTVSDLLGRIVYSKEFSKPQGTFAEWIAIDKKLSGSLVIVSIREGNLVLSEKIKPDR